MQKGNRIETWLANWPPCMVGSRNGRYAALVIGKGINTLVEGLLTLGQMGQNCLQIDCITPSWELETIAEELRQKTFMKTSLRWIGSMEKEQRKDYIRHNGKQYQQLFLYENGIVTELGEEGMQRPTKGLLEFCEKDMLEQLAREIFLEYQEGHGGSATFASLTTFEQQANYSCAMHIPTKLYLAGIQIRKMPSGLGEVIGSQQEFVDFLGEEGIYKFCKMEHLRWCAFYLSHGYHTLSIQQLNGRVHDKEHHRHGCLVSWEDLQDVSKLTGWDYQKEDRDRVVEIFRYVSRCGHVLEKIKPETCLGR